MTDTTEERRPQATRDAAPEVQATTPDDDTTVTVPATWRVDLYGEPPRVQPVHVSRPDRQGNRSVTVRCVYCGRRHVHGWAADDGEVGHRVTHCDRDIAHLGYVIVTGAVA